MQMRHVPRPVVGLLLLAGAASLAAPATGQPTPRASYVVQVAAGSEASVQARAKALGGEIGYVYDTALRGFSVTLPVSAATALARSAGVLVVEPDGIMTADALVSSPPSWGLDRVDQASLPLSSTYSYTTAGESVTAYVIDTGINSGITDFQGRVVGGINFVNSSTGNSKWQDCNGHGTHVAGTIGSATYGIAKNVKLFAVRVLDCRGSGSMSGVIAGVNWVAKNHGPSLVVANMSLGGGFYSTLNTAVNSAVTSGVVMAVAAGNSNADACNTSPASASAALTVAAADSGDNRASFSNWGACVDLFAPGVSIVSWDGKSGSPASWSGTSMATPHVVGVAARYLSSNPSATSAASVITSILGATASGQVTDPKGSPNKTLYAAPSL